MNKVNIYKLPLNLPIFACQTTLIYTVASNNIFSLQTIILIKQVKILY